MIFHTPQQLSVYKEAGISIGQSNCLATSAIQIIVLYDGNNKQIWFYNRACRRVHLNCWLNLTRPNSLRCDSSAGKQGKEVCILVLLRTWKISTEARTRAAFRASLLISARAAREARAASFRAKASSGEEMSTDPRMATCICSRSTPSFVRTSASCTKVST